MTADEWEKRYEDVLHVVSSITLGDPQLAGYRARNYMNTNYGPKPVDKPVDILVGGTVFSMQEGGLVRISPPPLHVQNSWDERQVRLAYKGLGKFVDFYDRHAEV